jgi:hypothetical protein
MSLEEIEICFKLGLIEDAVERIKESGLQTRDQPLTETNIALLGSVLKKAIGKRRFAWKVIGKELNRHFSVGNDRLTRLCENERQIVENELLRLVSDGLRIVRSQNTSLCTLHAHLEILKLQADMLRYLIEVYNAKPREHKDRLIDTVKQAGETYEQAMSLVGSTGLDGTHPAVLGLKINFSVFMYEFQRRRREACLLAKQALESAGAKLGPLAISGEPNSSLDPKLVRLIQILRDNLVLWTSTAILPCFLL